MAVVPRELTHLVFLSADGGAVGPKSIEQRGFVQKSPKLFRKIARVARLEEQTVVSVDDELGNSSQA